MDKIDHRYTSQKYFTTVTEASSKYTSKYEYPFVLKWYKRNIIVIIILQLFVIIVVAVVIVPVVAVIVPAVAIIVAVFGLFPPEPVILLKNRLTILCDHDSCHIYCTA